jgi:hypothetical protein
MSPRRRPDGLVGAFTAYVPVEEPPLLPALDVEPPEELDEPPPAGDAVPTDGVPAGWECWAKAAAGSARAPIRIADERERVI